MHLYDILYVNTKFLSCLAQNIEHEYILSIYIYTCCISHTYIFIYMYIYKPTHIYMHIFLLEIQ